MISLTKMEKIINPITSFFIFTFCISKYLLIYIFEIIPKYGDLNRLISWLFILPLTIIGFLISVIILFKSHKEIKTNYINILLVLPMIFYVLYFFIFK